MDQTTSDIKLNDTPAVSQEISPVNAPLDKIEAYDSGGRPTKMTDATLALLREAFMMGCSDDEACLKADISPQTLYNYQKINPKYVTLKKGWKANPFLLARSTVLNSLSKVENAKWYLERYDRGQVTPGFQQNTQVNVFGELKDKYRKEVVIDTTPTERPNGNKDGD